MLGGVVIHDNGDKKPTVQGCTVNAKWWNDKLKFANNDMYHNLCGVEGDH